MGLQMTKHDRIIIILDPTFEIMKISLLWTELFNFPKRGADLAKNRLESTLCVVVSPNSFKFVQLMYEQYQIKLASIQQNFNGGR